MMKITSVNNQRGAALVTALMIMSLLTVIGFSALNNSDIELKISGNERVSAQAFASAEAGIEEAIAELRAGQLMTTKKVWSNVYDAFDFDTDFNTLVGLTPLDPTNPGNLLYPDGFKGFSHNSTGINWTYAILFNSTDANRAFIASTGREGTNSVRNLLVEVKVIPAKSILEYAIYAEDDLNLGNQTRVLSYNSDKTLHLTTDTDATGDKADNTNTFDAETLEADIGSNTEINVGNFTYVAGDISLGEDESGVEATYTATGSKSVVLGADSFETTVDGELVLSENAYTGRVEVDQLFNEKEDTLVAQAITWLGINHAAFDPSLELDATVTPSEITESITELDKNVIGVNFPITNDPSYPRLNGIKGYKIDYIGLVDKLITIENDGKITYDENDEKEKDQINQINLFVSDNNEETIDNKKYSINLFKSIINIETPVIANKFFGYIGEEGGKNYTKGELSTSIIVDDIGKDGNILRLCLETGETYCSADDSGVYSIPHEGRRFSMLSLSDEKTFILDSKGNRVLRDQIFYLANPPDGVDYAYSSIKVLGAGVNMFTIGEIYFGTSGESELNNNIYVLDGDTRIRLVNEHGDLILGPPTIFSLYSTTTGKIRFSTKTAFSGLIYAPYADVQIDNKAGFRGSVIAKTFGMTNTGSFIYDSALKPTGDDVQFKEIEMQSWLEF